MQPFFSDELVPIPNSEGGSIIFIAAFDGDRIPQNLIPQGTSAMAVINGVPSSRNISFDGSFTAPIALPTGAFNIIKGRAMIDAAGFGRDSNPWLIQFFRTS